MRARVDIHCHLPLNFSVAAMILILIQNLKIAMCPGTQRIGSLLGADLSLHLVLLPV